MGPHMVGRAFKESLTALHMLPVEDPCKPKSLHFQQILDQEHGWVEVAMCSITFLAPNRGSQTVLSPE